MDSETSLIAGNEATHVGGLLGRSWESTGNASDLCLAH